MTRAVVTGIGVVAPNGIGTEAFWKATVEGVSGLRPITRFDTSRCPVQVAGEVVGFDARDYIPRRVMVETDAWTQFGMAAGQMALEDAKVDATALAEYAAAVITASSSGGNEFGQREIQRLWSDGPRAVSAYQSIAWFYAATSGQLSIRHGFTGPCGVIATEGAGGIDALGHARRQIRRGVRVVLTGGTEAPVSPYAVTCQLGARLLSTSDDPDKAYLPFSPDANGYCPGEGGAMLVVESLTEAQRRGAPDAYAEVTGYGATHDGHLGDEVTWKGLSRAIAVAMADAGLAPADLDLVVADAIGTTRHDAAEVAALEHVLGPSAGGVPVTAPKSMVGRLYSGGASLDLAVAALAVRHGVIPPTVHVDDLADGVSIDLVRAHPRRKYIRHVLVVARGFGGFNAAAVLSGIRPA